MSTKPLAFKTPKGQLAWVIITGEGKENLSGKFKYCGDLVLATDSAECQALIKKIKDFWAENKPAGFRKAAKSLGFRPEMAKVLDDNGNETFDEDGAVVKAETGNTVFTFSTDPTYPSGDPKVITTYNSKGNKVDLGQKKIGNGSEGNIGGAMGVYAVKAKGAITDAGVTLYLNSIRLTKFVEFTSEESWDDAGEDNGWTGEGETDGWEGEEGQEETPANNGAKPRL